MGTPENPTKRPRVLLADDHTLLLEAFEKLLEPKCEVVGAVADGRALLASAPALEPDIIVLDIAMPSLNGLDAGRQIKRRLPQVKLIFLTVSEDPDLAAEALQLGASGYLLKNSAASELFEAIQQVLRGQTYVTPRVAEWLREPLQRVKRRNGFGKLTPRQREVLQLLAEGHSMKEVATALDLTARTVAFHKYRMMEELRIKTSAELIQFAVKLGLVSP